MGEIKFAVRVLRKQPGFTAAVVATLALGIGSAVTVFSVVDAWLLRPLNFPRADRLVIGLGATRERPADPAIFSLYRDYLAWKARTRSFERMSAAFRRAYLMTGGGEPTTALGLAVTGDFFATLGVQPLIGRSLSDRDLANPAVAVLSYGLWSRQFGASNAVLGTRVTLNGVPHEIVGVMPREFDVRLLDPGAFELWTPLETGETAYRPGGAGPVAVVARLRDGVSLDTAAAEGEAIRREVESAYTTDVARYVVQLASLQADNTRTVRTTLVTVSGAVGCLVMIACMNVGTLLLGRGVARTREAAIRAAIGSGRARLVRQFLVEALLLTAAGGLLGVALSAGAVRLFEAANPLGILPAHPVTIDLRVLGFAVFLTAATAIACGVVPAFRTAAVDPGDALRDGGERSSGTRTQRTQAVLLASQLAGSVVLLVATTLLVRTFVRLQHEPLGFDAANLTVVSLALPIDEYGSSAKRNAFVEQVAERLAARPAVVSVAAGTSPPLSSGAPVSVRATADDIGDPLRISAQEISIGFFKTLGIPLIAGRDFGAADTPTGPAVAVLNEAAAQMMFGATAGAVGRRFRIGSRAWRDVVGVVANTKSSFYNTLEWLDKPVIYLPAPQAFSTIADPTVRSFGVHLHVRSRRQLAMSEVRDAVSSIGARAAITKVTTASDAVSEATRQPAFRVVLLGWFAAASLVLAAIGVYGLVSQGVAQRMREIGIRLALGAGGIEIITAVTRQAVITAAMGAAGGVVLAFALSRTLEAVVYGVRATDASSFAVAAFVLLAVAAIAALLPALRATGVNPVQILRRE